MEIVEFKEYINNLNSYLQRDKKTVVVVSDKTYCLKGTYSTLNEDYCKSNDVEILKTRHFGGTIINFKEDVCVGNFQKNDNNWAMLFMNRFINFLRSKGLDVALHDNDVLVDGFKCASFMTTNVNGILYSAIHISIGMNLELIKNICTKPMNKIPKGLKDYGISKEEVLSVVSSFEKEIL